MSMTALPKLEELVSDLDRQEEEVASQLEAVRAKLEAVRAVLPLFDESEGAVTTSTVSKPKATSKASKAPTSSSPAKSTKKTTKGKSKKKKDGRAASWQKYTRPGVKNQSIPDAVKLILSTQPDKEFKIAEVMAALFKDNMPKTQYLKARNRVSNVLSGGVRAGDWYRGGRSTYRMSAE